MNMPVLERPASTEEWQKDDGSAESKRSPTTRTRRRVAALAALVAVTVVAVGLWSFDLREHRGDGPAPPRAVAAVAPKPVALGVVEPVSLVVTVAGPTGQDAGRIASVLVEEGQSVTQGEILAVLDTEPALAAEAARAVAEVETRSAYLAKVRADLSEREATLGAKLSEQRAELERSKWDLEKHKSLTNAGVYRDPVLIDKQYAVKSAEARIASTEISLRRTIEVAESGVKVDEAEALAELAAAQAGLEKARADQYRASIRAPISGRILTIHGRLRHQLTDAGFAEMADTSQMLIRAEVLEADVAAIRVGDNAEVVSRAIATPLSGRVVRKGVRVQKQSVASSDPAAIVDARVVEVWLRLNPMSSRSVDEFTGLQVIVRFL
jgi:HlyD family secretion protein